MNKVLKYAIITCITVGLLDAFSYSLLPYLPEDAVFNLGPTLGILKEHRMVDLLVYKEFNTYYGYPPLFFAIQAFWFGLTGFSAWSIITFVIIVHVLIIAAFFYALRNVLSPFLISLLSIIFFSCLYFTSGRPDPVAVIFILLLSENLMKLSEEINVRGLAIASGLLCVIFYIHPLAFVISAFIFYLTLLVRHKLQALKPLIISAVGVAVFIGGTYIPFVLSDLTSWHALFVKLAQRQENFNISAAIKFWGLNLGTLIFMLSLFVFSKSRFIAFIKNKDLWIIAIGFALVFLFGMSYYYLYPFTFLLISILFFFKNEIKNTTLAKGSRVYLFWSICAVAALVGLYQGALGKVVQGLRRPDFAQGLQEMRTALKTIDFGENQVYSDFQMLPALLPSDNLNLIWHGMKYFRSEPNAGSYFVINYEETWNSNQTYLGSWQDSTRYEVVMFHKPISGLPALYSLKGKGQDLQLRIIRKR